ncbi:MAG: sigma 54-interacting transcriptional regulator [Proteobacteria bacterium]|nr:sigma 54-interacting transcriptional regulator [Pseudomonadota bacterium]
MNDIIGNSSAIIQTNERIKAVSITDASVLISGESGVGKELVATQIHEGSSRSTGPLITVNCASIPRELFESEFFGHVKGAFTGAIKSRVGRFELADKGTLFLDEVGEIPLDLQGKLLRALQQSSFERIGEEITRKVDIRIIAATNRNLEEEVDKNRFREDLFYRLSIFPINVPPLRKRKEDIPLLASYFFKNSCEQYNKEFTALTDEQFEILMDYDWPGNVRELKSIIERAVILSKDKFRLDLALPEDALKQVSYSTKKMAENMPPVILTDEEFRQLERKNMIAALESTNWKVSGIKGAAKLLGIKTTTLSSRMKALSIEKPDKSSLYYRLGGYSAISKFVNELLPRLRTDPDLGRFWQNRGVDSIGKEKQYLVEYLCEVTGGPYNYTGRHMQQTHEGLNITGNDWEIFLERVNEVANLAKIKSKELGEIQLFLNEIKPMIIER